MPAFVLTKVIQLIILSEGEIGYWGPVGEALAYFDALGFSCPAHYSAAEFLAEVVRANSRSWVTPARVCLYAC